MNKSDIGLNAGKIWRLLSNYAKWGLWDFEEKVRAEGQRTGSGPGMVSL